MAELIALPLVIWPRQIKELLELAASACSILCQKNGELPAINQSRTLQSVAGCGSAHAEVLSHLDYVVKLDILAPWSRSRSRLDRRLLVEHVGIHPARPSFPEGVDKLTHCIRRHQEARSKSVGPHLDQLVAILPRLTSPL